MKSPGGDLSQESFLVQAEPSQKKSKQDGTVLRPWSEKIWIPLSLPEEQLLFLVKATSP